MFCFVLILLFFSLPQAQPPIQLPSMEDFRVEAPYIPNQGRYCQPFAVGLVQCFTNFANGQLKAVEVFEEGSEVPESATYLREDGQLLADWSVKRGYLMHIGSGGEVLQTLAQNRYQSFQNGKAEVECIGDDCRHQEKVFLPPPKDLRPGDLLFTGNLFPWSGLIRVPITHVAVVHSVTATGILLIENDMFEPLQLIPLSRAFQKTFAYAVLRNEEFGSEFLKVRDRLFSNSFPVPYFCGNMLQELVRRIRPEWMKGWDHVDKNFAELILLNLMPHFEVAAFLVPEEKSAEDYRASRLQKTPAIRAQIGRLAEAQNLFWQLFREEFPLQPVGVRPKTLQDLVHFVRLYQP